MARKSSYINREISWLAFNGRVLQEAADPNVPLVERLRFLGIFSNNRDEFFRVRVASLNRLIEVGGTLKSFLGGKPKKILEQIQETVIDQEKRFLQVYKDIIKGLEQENIIIVNEKKLNKDQKAFVKQYFEDKVQSALSPIMIDKAPKFPYLKEKHIYLAIKLIRHDDDSKSKYGLMEIPIEELDRFIVLPDKGARKCVMLLDDVIRFNLDRVFHLFNYDVAQAFSIKLTRDAELDLDDDFSKSFVEKMSKSVKNRLKGEPVRLSYDASMPVDLLQFILKKMSVDDQDTIIPGGRYHHFRDFMKFPNVGLPALAHLRPPVLQHQGFKRYNSVFEAISKQDVLLHFPYQSFGYIIDLLREAAIDPQVSAIKMTLYRVAPKSKVIKALINAAKNGKKVTVVLEIQARFDEEANITWSNLLQEEGVDVLFGVPGLKVHAKLCLITRKEGKKSVNYAAISTGNFNERTSNVYADHCLLTSKREITSEVNKIFSFFNNTYRTYRYKHLIVSPLHTRHKMLTFINKEIKNAQAGRNAWIFLKMNSLSDPDVIRKLIEAGQAGVKVRLIVRGICCLIPGELGLSENIRVISIVDKYLEHSRIFMFANGGDEQVFISSADMMTRNLDRRIEITCPIVDKAAQRELKKMMEMQWSDNVKARIIDGSLSNSYQKTTSKASVRAQVDYYNYLQAKHG